VLRVGNRLGIADSDDADRVEQQLTGALPPGWWTRASDTLILHGRRVCKPEPLCGQCAAADACAFFAEASRLPARDAPARGARRPAASGGRTRAGTKPTAAPRKRPAKTGRR
jgi:endonuclease-3